jgi:hypothetical protein
MKVTTNMFLNSVLSIILLGASTILAANDEAAQPTAAPTPNSPVASAAGVEQSPVRLSDEQLDSTKAGELVAIVSDSLNCNVSVVANNVLSCN